jgi:hypothetical protein
VVEVTPAVAEAFVVSRTTRGAQPSPATCRLRRTAVTVLFREMRNLRLAQAAPTLDLQLPSRGASDYRPLTDDEVEACRWASLATTVATRQPAVMALAEAGTWPVEVNEIRVGDINLNIGQVRLAGGAKTAPCTVSLTGWGVLQVRRRLLVLDLGEDRRVAYEGNGSEHSRRTSAAQALRTILVRAGLGGAPGVEPRSVTVSAGARLLDDGGRIEEAARRLGLSSLDSAADAIDYQWLRGAD